MDMSPPHYSRSRHSCRFIQKKHAWYYSSSQASFLLTGYVCSRYRIRGHPEILNSTNTTQHFGSLSSHCSPLVMVTISPALSQVKLLQHVWPSGAPFFSHSLLSQSQTSLLSMAKRKLHYHTFVSQIKLREPCRRVCATFSQKSVNTCCNIRMAILILIMAFLR